MYFGAIDSESLTNPTIANTFDQIRTFVEYERNSKTNEYHNVFIVKISDNNLNKFMNKISRLLKKEWYSLYWKGDSAIIQYRDKAFRIELSDSKTHKEAIKHGLKGGIETRFLDFNKYISSYKRYISTRQSLDLDRHL